MAMTDNPATNPSKPVLRADAPRGLVGVDSYVMLVRTSPRDTDLPEEYRIIAWTL